MTSRSDPLYCNRCHGVRVLVDGRWLCATCGNEYLRMPSGSVHKRGFTRGEREYLAWLTEKRHGASAA